MEVRWSIDRSGDLHLSWAERNGPPVAIPSRRSFGTQVIERNIPDQLGGTASVRWLPVGLSCDFIVPAAYVVQMQLHGAEPAGRRPLVPAGSFAG